MGSVGSKVLATEFASDRPAAIEYTNLLRLIDALRFSFSATWTGRTCDNVLLILKIHFYFLFLFNSLCLISLLMVIDRTSHTLLSLGLEGKRITCRFIECPDLWQNLRRILLADSWSGIELSVSHREVLNPRRTIFRWWLSVAYLQRAKSPVDYTLSM